MEASIFTKLKAKQGMSATVFNSPVEYPRSSDLRWDENRKFDFVHLFISSKSDFEKWFSSAASTLNTSGLFWLSYPKSSGEHKYDINRDSLWDMLLPKGWHPVAQVSLGDKWSAIRLKANEPGKEYVRPVNTKTKTS